MAEHRIIDLRDVAAALAKQFSAVTTLSLFGSRRHRTRSLRSDLDLLVEVDDFLKPGELRDFLLRHFPFVDAFLLDGKRAVSCINDSFVEADSKEQLVKNLQAVEFWARGEGVRASADVDFQQKIAQGQDFAATSLPNLHIAEEARRRAFNAAGVNGMPSIPYLGSTAIEVADFLTDLIRRLIPRESDLRGRAKWAAKPLSEYEFQSLFWIAAKPWLPALAREEVTIQYDNQKKVADFNYGRNQIVIEMKHVTSTGTKAAIVKTLGGLADFYVSHPNIRVLLFAVLVDDGVQLDSGRLEADFSHLSAMPQVRTIVVRNAAAY